MDLNLSRRKRERAVAKEVADAFLQATDATELAPPEKLAHHFALVYERLGIMPDDAAVSRVLHYASKEIARRGRVLDDLVTALNRFPPAELQP
jgi:hypothetical protein